MCANELLVHQQSHTHTYIHAHSWNEMNWMHCEGHDMKDENMLVLNGNGHYHANVTFLVSDVCKPTHIYIYTQILIYKTFKKHWVCIGIDAKGV